MLKLTGNLQLTSIEENNIQGDKILAVVCTFTFFGEEGITYISINNLEDDDPCYRGTEISSELFDSFNDLLEKNWFKIIKQVKDFIKEWEFKNAD